MGGFDFNSKEFDKFSANFEGLLKDCDEFNSTFLKQSTEVCTGDIRRDTPVDSGNMRARWQTSGVTKNKDTFSITISNPVEYASHVEDGHWTTGEGVKQRWVPGYWQGNKFIYDPNVKTGMLLKSKFIEGKHMARININKLEFRLASKYEAAFKHFAKEHGL